MTPGLWKHRWRPIAFALVVDDFGVEYTNTADATHLITALKQHYEFEIDWDGKLFCGITLDWDYNAKTVCLSMPGYIAKALRRFEYSPKNCPQDAPHTHTPIQYSKTTQYAPINNSPSLSPPEIKHIQEVVGTFLYYTQAVDPTLMAALSSIASAQSKGTQQTQQAVEQFLDFCHLHPNAIITYHASPMQLAIDLDASYLSEPTARSQAAGHFYFTSAKNSRNNGAILVISTIIQHALASALEAELAAMYLNAREAIPL